MRETLRYFTEELGKTVVISSHLLHEVELLADVVGIIDRGKLLREGELATAARGRRPRARCASLPQEMPKAAEILQQLGSGQAAVRRRQRGAGRLVHGRRIAVALVGDQSRPRRGRRLRVGTRARQRPRERLPGADRHGRRGSRSADRPAGRRPGRAAEACRQRQPRHQRVRQLTGLIAPSCSRSGDARPRTSCSSIELALAGPHLSGDRLPIWQFRSVISFPQAYTFFQQAIYPARRPDRHRLRRGVRGRGLELGRAAQCRRPRRESRALPAGEVRGAGDRARDRPADHVRRLLRVPLRA